MKKIKLKLEYKCFPVWLYDENDELIDNDLPDEVLGNAEVELPFITLQNKFDSLFQDDGIQFSYKGFTTYQEKEEFLNAVQSLERLLETKVGSKYRIVNEINKARIK